MKWRSDPCEIMELGIAPEFQRQGLGKEFVAWLIQEARQRGKRQILVGTSNSSIANIAFYQKCGFRMDHVRQDYFWYLPEPSYENSIQIQDLLVFRFDLVPSSTRKNKLKEEKQIRYEN
ncbi:GNAT family N-acetyltransferase [Nostoc sp.]